MSEDARAAQIAHAFEAFNRGDLEAVSGFLYDDVTSHVSPRLLNTGTWHGRDGFFDMVMSWNEAFTETRFDVRSALHLDERFTIACVRQSSRGSQSGVPVEMEPAYLIQLVDGRALTFEVHPDRDEAMASYREHTGQRE